jgi:hypothetical protein
MNEAGRGHRNEKEGIPTGHRLTGMREVQTQAFTVGQVCFVFFFWLRITLELVINMIFMFLSLFYLMRITGVGRMKPR